MLQLVLTLIIYLILVIPVGRYLYHIAAGKHTFAFRLHIVTIKRTAGDWFAPLCRQSSFIYPRLPE